MNIKQKFSSVAHPQTNGEVEVTNKIIVTTTKTSTGDTLFGLTYRMDALLPPKIEVQTHTVITFDPERHEQLCRQSLDLIEERRVDVLKDMEKLDQAWEGLFKVVGILLGGAYQQANKQGETLKRPWNVQQLKKLYA
ncbi:hypothetical protein CDL12_03377 [Handroanthus impetiginosus]|uniref:Uncharacterized protein n=1 Tax=Handroanthus impetiginosus TaxID=429701 RepID=A0A2G9I2C0_9LAMI|nr:hypothetical protein CDL12_03377 [Handroanthus impetiginosus]